MQSKYKISLLKANLLAAAVALSLWIPSAEPAAAVMMWLSIGWLLITALILDFSHRRSRGLPWQMLAGTLLLGLIASAPDRHALLIWTWGAVFMLPQDRWAAVFNGGAALVSCLVLLPHIPLPEWLLMTLSLSILLLLAMSRTHQLLTINGVIRQRLRLIPGLNLWAGEQLLRDLIREQTRSEREAIHADVLIVRVRRRQLWPVAQKLCELTYDFENVYRLNSTTLATLMLSKTPGEAASRRTLLVAALPDNVLTQHTPLMDIELAALTLDELSHFPASHLREVA
ncbi:hypothetical protein HaloA020_26530 [Halomonas sp. A020]|uniref:hypothetical protein n=1 Tax=Halomonas sp. A020 TaxID=2717374 RepID=UPI002491B153|nr:hypothetical protein [Halomonas sp. A020]BCB61952.1 hypothetical protein HaloA020_26530 [Halomonas sp. A020]